MDGEKKVAGTITLERAQKIADAVAEFNLLKDERDALHAIKKGGEKVAIAFLDGEGGIARALGDDELCENAFDLAIEKRLVERLIPVMIAVLNEEVETAFAKVVDILGPTVSPEDAP